MPMQQNTRQLDVNINAIGDNIVVPLVAGRKIRIWQLDIKAVGIVGIIFKNGVGGTAFNARPIPLAAGERFEKVQQEIPFWQTSKGADFVINTDAVGPITGRIDYTLL